MWYAHMQRRNRYTSLGEAWQVKKIMSKRSGEKLEKIQIKVKMKDLEIAKTASKDLYLDSFLQVIHTIKAHLGLNYG